MGVAAVVVTMTVLIMVVMHVGSVWGFAVLVVVTQDAVSFCLWWWRGSPPRECSAWKMASETS